MYIDSKYLKTIEKIKKMGTSIKLVKIDGF